MMVGRLARRSNGHGKSRMQTILIRKRPLEPLQQRNAVHLLSFRSGKGELFRKVLLEEKEFRSLREELRGGGLHLVPFEWGIVVPFVMARKSKAQRETIDPCQEYP